MSEGVQNLELGNYRVLHHHDGGLWVLGKGSYGTTYKGEHRHLRRVCALKVINEHLVRNDEAKIRFLQEAQAAASLDHPQIAPIYDFGEQDGLFYYAMSYCAGGDLEQFAATRGRQSWETVEEFARQIFSALAAAHRQGLLHRDIKPSNVMLASPESPVSLRLIDFGLVKALGKDDPSDTAPMRTQEGAFMGNPLTASPEQFREEVLDERSDLYSAGVTLWYLLVGGSPFGRASSAQIAQQRLSVEDYDQVLPDDLCAKGRAILNRLLATDKERRFRTAEEVLAALEDLSGTAGAGSVRAEVLDESWALEGVVRQFDYGSYYRCWHLSDPSIPPATLFIPEKASPDYDQVISAADRLTGLAVPGLCGFRVRGTFDDARAYLCEALPGGSLAMLLEQSGCLGLTGDSGFLMGFAEAFDAVAASGGGGVELADAAAPIGVDPAFAREPANAAEWRDFLAGPAREDGGSTKGIRPRLLPRLGGDSLSREASSTIGGDDLATTPAARFGAFLYRVLSGMSVKQSAYLTPLNYVSFSDVSEESNRYLAEVIAGKEDSVGAVEMLGHLRHLEGCEPIGPKTRRSASAASRSAVPTLHPPDPPPPSPWISRSGPIISAAATAAGASPAPPPPPGVSRSGPIISAAATAAGTIPPIGPKAQAATATIPPIPPRAQAATIGQPVGPVEAPPPASPKRGRIWIAAAAALVLVVGALGFVGAVFLKRGDSAGPGTGIETPVEKGSGHVTFSQLELSGKLPDGVPLALVDAAGTQVGVLRSEASGVVVEDFPLQVFDQDARWPLGFMVLDRRFLADGPKLERGDFSGRDSGNPVFNERILLRVAEYADLPVDFRLGGEALEDWVPLLAFLSVDGDAATKLMPGPDGELRVVLGPGGAFPVSLELAVPSLKPLGFQVSPGDRISGELRLEERDLRISGAGTSGVLRFEPDVSAAESEGFREIYRRLAGIPETEVRDLLATDGKWRLPKLPGLIVLAKDGREGRSIITHDTSFLVLVNLTNRLEEESGEIGEKRREAERGSLDAQFELAQLYHKSNGGEASMSFAFRWYELAAEQGDRTSQFNLGLLYRDGKGFQSNPREAARWYRKAAENGYASAMSEYGLCLRFGIGVEKDEAEAERWLLKCAEEGDALGMNNLGLLYGDEESPLHDPQKSFEWFTKSAEAGNAEGMFYLGYSYQNGLGIPVDPATARQWYEAAKEKGNDKAARALEALGP